MIEAEIEISRAELDLSERASLVEKFSFIPFSSSSFLFLSDAASFIATGRRNARESQGLSV